MKVRFYKKRSGRDPVKEFLDECSNQVRDEFLDAKLKLENGVVLGMPLSRSLAGIFHGLHELRMRDGSGQFRFFYYVKKGDAIYFVHAFQKKTQELPKHEIEVILKRVKEILYAVA